MKKNLKHSMPQRTFIPGSKWVYYKIYCGTKTADRILTELIRPLTSILIEEKYIDKWFFIRYSNPENHIRLRLLIIDKVHISYVLNQFYMVLQVMIEDDLVSNVQLDTYNRELERYGSDAMELSEMLFYHQSQMVLNFLHMVRYGIRERLRWLFGLRAIDNLLDGFQYDLSKKLKLLDILKSNFAKEFGMERNLKKQIDIKYRNEREEITRFLSFKVPKTDEETIFNEILIDFNNNSKLVIKQILDLKEQNKSYIKKNALVSSYIHMLMNRLFISKNRLNEMVCYDFLFRYYKSKFAILNKKEKAI